MLLFKGCRDIMDEYIFYFILIIYLFSFSVYEDWSSSWIIASPTTPLFFFLVFFPSEIQPYRLPPVLYSVTFIFYLYRFQQLWGGWVRIQSANHPQKCLESFASYAASKAWYVYLHLVILIFCYRGIGLLQMQGKAVHNRPKSTMRLTLLSGFHCK
jgi:hypothetical protein